MCPICWYCPPPSPHLTTEPVSCLISCRCVSPLWGYCDERFWLNISVLRILCTVITTIILPSLITDFIGHASCVSSSSPAPGPPLIPPPKYNWIKSTLNGNNSPSSDKKVDKNILIVSRLFYLMSWHVMIMLFLINFVGERNISLLRRLKQKFLGSDFN